MPIQIQNIIIMNHKQYCIVMGRPGFGHKPGRKRATS